MIHVCLSYQLKIKIKYSGNPEIQKISSWNSDFKISNFVEFWKFPISGFLDQNQKLQKSRNSENPENPEIQKILKS
jgi:hypothetical protein